MTILRLVACCVLFLGLAGLLPAAPNAAFPNKQAVLDLLGKEPITAQSWPAWRQRLIDWFGDPSRNTDPAYKAAGAFLLKEVQSDGKLPPRWADDPIAWYVLAGGYSDTQLPDRLAKVEAASRASVARDPSFARAHRRLGQAIALQVKPNAGGVLSQGDQMRLADAEREAEEASRLDPQLPIGFLRGLIELTRGKAPAAQALLEREMRLHPEDIGTATMLAQSIVFNQQNTTPAAGVQRIAERFPDEPGITAMYALALAIEQRPREAASQLERVRAQGEDPAKILGPELVRNIEDAGAPGWIERFLWIMAGFVAFYAVVMLLMAGAGFILASRTRGRHALSLLEVESAEELVSGGQVARVGGETALARIYGLCLMLGLVLFYLSIPFVLAGLLAITGGLLVLIFMLGRIPVKLVLIVVVIGGGMIWAVLKSLFTRPSGDPFGIPKSAEDCPRLHQLLTEVAERVDTDPIHEVFIAPGSAVGVHQEGRGPFGVFGVKRRVLTLGLSTLRALNLGELRSILAHEYAHFSHRDTFYSRFIFQVHTSIEQALWGMGGAGGWINYVNPFYWFLYLYYRSYSLLAAGYSRSREFLADRMACSLYGSDVFTGALTKVCTDGTLFDATMYENVANLVRNERAYVNMYQAFEDFRDQQESQEKRAALQEELTNERGSLFASHPTYKERIEAAADLPAARTRDTRPAMSLFDKPAEVEEELTKFLTDYMAYLEQLRAQAEAAAAQQA